MKEMKIFITLRSDLCASSGKGWSATIDNDVCFDEYGLPYIPARRIKGCLKAAASLLEMPADAVNRLFGIGGAGADENSGWRTRESSMTPRCAATSSVWAFPPKRSRICSVM